MLRHVARFAPQHRLLLLGTYRDVELDAQHPLTDALGALYRETTCERILLKGLSESDVAQLIADSEVPSDRQATLANAISAVTNGNPFFVREVLHHLVEEGQLAGSADTKLGIPDSVRQVLSRRVRRLSAESGRLLSVAAAFGGPFHLGVAAQVAGLDEAAALNAIDEALRAQLVRPADSRRALRLHARADSRDAVQRAEPVAAGAAASAARRGDGARVRRSRRRARS